MNGIAIRAESLGKRYLLGERAAYRTVRERLMEAATAPARWIRSHEDGRAPGGANWMWALRDVSFELREGDVLGLIGRNGAGKSTLLKILSRVTRPTHGVVEVRGRMGSLLEVGTGFHPELTGRENVFLNGAILGMGGREIARKFDEIVAFAEVERFIDTPVKHYSSGMYMRLAFSVAAHLEPEILVVDEVLAVGDAAFQKKCLGKMGRVAQEGRTVVFVSHNMRAVAELCRSCVWLDGGSIVESGTPQQVILSYLSSRRPENPGGLIADSAHINASGDLYFRRVQLLDSDGQPQPTFYFGEPLRIELEFEVCRAAEGLRVGVAIEELGGTLVSIFHNTDEGDGAAPNLNPGRYIARLTVPLALMPGGYTIHLGAKPAPGFYGDKSPGWDWVQDAVTFHVEEFSSGARAVLPTGAVVRPTAQWIIVPTKVPVNPEVMQ